MRIKQIKHLIDYVNSPKQFITHAAISLQIRVYSPRFVIKFLNTTILTRQQSYHFRKYATKEYTENTIAHHSHYYQKISQATWLKNYFFENKVS